MSGQRENRESVTLDDLMKDMNETEKALKTPKKLDAILEKPIYDDIPEEKAIEVNVQKEEDQLLYYKEKLAEQVQQTREILGNFQLISRHSKYSEGIAERYKEELIKHKEYFNLLLEQQGAALSAYKSKILELDREKIAYRKAYRELSQQFETYQEQAQQYFKEVSAEQVDRYKVYIQKLQDYITLQNEKKEFYKNELRQRVMAEPEYEERENQYREQMNRYEEAIEALRAAKGESNPEEAPVPESNPEDDKPEEAVQAEVPKNEEKEEKKEDDN